MADLLPDLQENFIPSDAFSVEEEQDSATANYLATLGMASKQMFDDIALPETKEDMAAVMSSKDGEKAIRETMAESELLKSEQIMDSILTDAIIAGANPEEVENMLSSATQEEFQSQANSIIERNAAKYLVNSGMQGSQERAAVVLSEEEKFMGSTDYTKTDTRELFAAKMFRLTNIKNKLQAKFKEENIAENVLDVAAAILVPGHTSLVEGQVFDRGLERLGTSVTKFSQNFWEERDVSKAMAIADQFEKDLETNSGGFSQNLLSAIQQIEQLMTHKNEDELMLNLTEALDASIVGVPLARAIKAYRNISAASRATGSTKAPVGRSVILRDQEKKGKELTVVEQDEMVNNSTPSSADPDAYYVDPKGNVNTGWAAPEKAVGPTERALTNTEAMETYEKVLPTLLDEAKKAGYHIDPEDVTPIDLLTTLRGTVTPTVLNETEQVAANLEAVKEILKGFNIPVTTRALIDPERFTDGTISKQVFPSFDVTVDNVSNIHTVNVFIGHGENKANGFVSEASAIKGAERLGLDPAFYSISDKTGEFYIKVSKTAEGLNHISLIKETEASKVFPIAGKYVQGSRGTQTLDAAKGANLSTKAATRLSQAVNKSVDNIRMLPKRYRNAFNSVMLEIHERGKWKTIDQFKEWYRANYQREASKKEVTAYLSHRQINDFDYLVRDSKTRRELVGLNLEEVRVTGIHAEGKSIIGKIVETSSLEPRVLRFYDNDSHKLMHFDSHTELAKFMAKKENTVLIKKLVGTKKTGDYIIASRTDVNTKPIRHNVLSKVDGPHRQYAGKNWIKQSKTRFVNGTEVRQNDRTHFNLEDTKEAKQYVDDYNDALDSFKWANKGTDADKLLATRIINENTMFSSYKEFAKAVEQGRIELTPFELVRDGEHTLHRADEFRGDQLDPDFKSLSHETMEMIETGRLYYSKRGPRLPHPKEGMATLADPHKILAQSVSNVIHTQAYTNHRIRQVQAWTKTYGKHLIGDANRPTAEQFMFGQFDLSSTAPNRLKASMIDSAEAQRMAVKRLLNTQGVMGETAHRYRDQVIDIIDNRANTVWADKFADITSNNAVAFARGVAFKAYLGMMDVSQLTVQLSMMPGVLATDPIRGAQALTAYTFMRGALLNPKHIGTMGEAYARATGGKSLSAKEFTLMVKDLRTSGTDIIDGNLGELDNMNNAGNIHSLIPTVTGKVTDSMSLFFNEAEKANRVISWSMAWMQNYKATGKGLTTSDEFASVGLKADSLAGMMSKDGKAWWQEGFLGLGTQFMAHPMRVFESMFNIKGGLSGKERLQAYAGLAAVYGPLLGAGSGFIAYAKQKYFDATGEEMDEATLDVFKNGLMQMLLPDTDINRLKPFGQGFLLTSWFDTTKGLTLGDFFGASGSLASGFYNAVAGSGKLASFIMGYQGFDTAPATLQEVAHDILKNVSSYNRMDKAITAIQTGNLYDKYGGLKQQDLNEFDAKMLALGFPPREGREAFEAISNVRAVQDLVLKDAKLGAAYLKKFMEAEEGSPEEKKNQRYFQYLRDKNPEYRDMFTRQVDKSLRDAKAYNQKAFEIVQRKLLRIDSNLIRGK